MFYDNEELHGFYQSADDSSLFHFDGSYYVRHGRKYLYVCTYPTNADDTVSMWIVKVYPKPMDDNLLYIER